MKMLFEKLKLQFKKLFAHRSKDTGQVKQGGSTELESQIANDKLATCSTNDKLATCSTSDKLATCSTNKTVVDTSPVVGTCPKEEPSEEKVDEIVSAKFEELRKEFNKLGKLQFRSNTLAETDRKQIKKNLLHLLEIHSNPKDNGRPDLGFIKDLLEVADGLDEAVKAIEKTKTHEQSITNWLSGIRITQRRIIKLFEKWDIRPIGTVGNIFDPNLHVSVDIKRTADVAENTVVEEQRCGYLLGNEVIRYAEVVVAKPPSVAEFSTEKVSRQTNSLPYKLTRYRSPGGCILWANDDFVD